jgi:hypothetical protein
MASRQHRHIALMTRKARSETMHAKAGQAKMPQSKATDIHSIQ